MALAFLIIGALVIIDQLTKYMVVQFLMPVGSVSVIGDFFKLTYLENRGAAFGVFQNQRWIFILFTFVILAVMLWIGIKYDIKSKMLYTSLVLVTAGGIGNLIDRIFLGYVIDFFSFSIFSSMAKPHFTLQKWTVQVLCTVHYITFSYFALPRVLSLSTTS